MLTKKEIYKQAHKELERRRLQRNMSRTNNLKKATSICHEIGALNIKLSKLSIKLSKAILSNNNNQIEFLNKIQNENLNIQSKIQKLLIKHNLPSNYLNPGPVCSKCDDYGYVDNKKCSCLINLLNSILTKDLQNNSHLCLKSFDDFNLEYYSKDIDNKLNISPYNHMSEVFKICKEFAYNFPSNLKGLIMMGRTGLGKTHLSLSIASYIISKGYTVIYDTASEITRKMSNRYFGRETNKDIDYIDLINDADLFIFDDLGSEFDSAFNKTAVFDVINNRVPIGLPTIINTNLSPTELEERYGERTVSRVFSGLFPISFIGSDIRKNVIN